MVEQDPIEIRWRGPPEGGQDRRYDPLIPVDVGGRALARTLIDHGVPTTYFEYPMGHSVAVAGLEEAHAWLLAVSAGERPSAAMPISGVPTD